MHTPHRDFIAGADDTAGTDSAAQLPRFLRTCALFAAPIVVLVAPALTVLAISGECFVSMDDIAHRARRQPVLVGFAYDEKNYGYLKYRQLTSLPRQSVIAVGSSRVLGFRREMFTSRFYNAGYTVVTAWDFRKFLAEVPETHRPDIVILGLDQFLFNSEYNEAAKGHDASDWHTASDADLQAALKVVPDVYKDVLRGRLKIGSPLSALRQPAESDGVAAFGLNAVVNRTGFRNDGSYSYGAQVDRLLTSDPSARDFGFAETLDRVRRGNRRFQHGAALDGDVVREISELLEFCSHRKMHVVAYLPPYADAVWQAMEASGEFAYATQIEAALRPHFDRHGFELYAFQCMSDCDASDEEAIDGFHAGEKTYLKMLIRMLERGSALNRFASLQTLRRDALQVVNRYVAYPDVAPPVQIAAGGVPTMR
ncbi:MAG: hypothetical protein R3C19_08180 [Planctomycetaceae bacterium]